MQQLRRNIKLKEGVGVDVLFTPHLFSYKEEKGLALTADAGNVLEVFEVYADIYYLAAINSWELDGKGTVDDFPFTRGDFHEYMMSNPKDFAKDVDFAIKALTGKSAKDFAQKEEPAEEKEETKKKSTGWITRLLRRS